VTIPFVPFMLAQGVLALALVAWTAVEAGPEAAGAVAHLAAVGVLAVSVPAISAGWVR